MCSLRSRPGSASHLYSHVYTSVLSLRPLSGRPAPTFNSPDAYSYSFRLRLCLGQSTVPCMSTPSKLVCTATTAVCLNPSRVRAPAGITLRRHLASEAKAGQSQDLRTLQRDSRHELLLDALYRVAGLQRAPVLHSFQALTTREIFARRRRDANLRSRPTATVT